MRGANFRLRRDLYFQENTFPLVHHLIDLHRIFLSDPLRSSPIFASRLFVSFSSNLSCWFGVWLNTANDCKGALHRTTEDRQSWENCQTCNNFCLIKKKIILFIFYNFVFFCVFCCEFWSFNELWRFTKRPFWDLCTFVKGRQHNFHGTANFMYCRSTPKIRYLMHAVARQS